MTFGESMATETQDSNLTLTLTPTEAALIVLFRRHVDRFKQIPGYWEFLVDCNPQRLTSKFTDCEVIRFDRSDKK